MYEDFGPATRQIRGHTRLPTQRWINRPFCDLCGPFRGRYLRKLGCGGGSECKLGCTETEWRCRGCDEED